MFDKKEKLIKKTLRRLAKQRVVLVLQPGNVWVVEKSINNDDETKAVLKTCHMRGWVEPLTNAIPQGSLQKDGSLPSQEIFNSVGPIHRLTEAGWNIIHRSQEWLVSTFVIALVTLIVTIIGLLLRS